MMTIDDPWLLEMFEAVSHVNFKPAHVRNMVHVTRAALGKQCDISSILVLKNRSTYDFIHEIMLPGVSMHGQKACLFKMSTTGSGSGIDLLTRMGPGKDLEGVWVMFGHVKRIHNWTTMACHIYEPNFCSLITSEMKREDADSQLLLWNEIKKCLVDRGIMIPDMKFMANNAMAN